VAAKAATQYPKTGHFWRYAVPHYFKDAAKRRAIVWRGWKEQTGCLRRFPKGTKEPQIPLSLE